MEKVGELEWKRASLLSAERFPIDDLVSGKSKKELAAPPDPYHLVHIMILCLGVAGAIPLSFFLTAQNYWMYKFRDTSSDGVDLDHKTTLQTNFNSLASTVNAAPAAITTLLATRYGHKINIKSRMIWTLSGMVSVFVVFTVFIKIDTDEWQMGFFVLTLFSNAVIAVFGSLFAATNLSVISRFPVTYLKTQMYTIGISSLLSVTLQIVSLSVTDSPTTVALIYFVCGTTFIFMGVVTATMIDKVPRFKYYLGDTVADTTRSAQTLSEMKETAKKMWPNITLMVYGLLLMGMGHPNISVLVVSESFSSGSTWATKYFSPVVTFMWPDIVGMVGRFLARPFMTPRNAIYVVIFDVIKTLTLGPLIMFCNAKPRSHLPVLFPHDWQYFTILSVTGLVNGFMTTSLFMSIQNMLPENPEQGFLLLNSFLIFISISSLLNPMWVHLL